jgi:hypothetical protein
MEYYINKSIHTGRYKVYKQDGSQIAIAVFDTEEQAINYILELTK